MQVSAAPLVLALALLVGACAPRVAPGTQLDTTYYDYRRADRTAARTP